MAGKPWTPEETEILIAMAKAGKTIRDARRVLVDRSAASINNKSSYLGIAFSGPKSTINLQAYAEIMKAEREVKCL